MQIGVTSEHRRCTSEVVGADELLWELPSMPLSAAGAPLLRTALRQMGSALLCLYEYGAGWTSDDTITVIEELFGEPVVLTAGDV